MPTTNDDIIARIDALETVLIGNIFVRYEYCNTGENSEATVRGIFWVAQTFTPDVNHKIDTVKIKTYRVGSPGIITISVRATDGEGKPTGSDLCSGVIDGDTITTNSSGEWYTASFASGVFLSKDTKYSIVVRATTGDTNNKVIWKYNTVSNAYLGGQRASSGDSGSVWVTAYGDMMFEEYSEPSLSDIYSISSETNSKFPGAHSG